MLQFARDLHGPRPNNTDTDASTVNPYNGHRHAVSESQNNNTNLHPAFSHRIQLTNIIRQARIATKKPPSLGPDGFP